MHGGGPRRAPLHRHLVALLLNLLVGPDLLAALARVGDALLDLLELRLGDLLGRLLLLDLVAEGVELVLLGERGRLGRLLLGLLARLLGGVHPLGARDGAAAVDDRPDLGAEGRVELTLMADDDAAAGVVLDGGGERAERVAVEEVGRLVEDEHVRLHPHGGGEDDLHLLPARERRHLRVRAELRLEVEVVEVLLDVERGELLGGDARRLEGDALVDLHHELLHRRLARVLRALLVRRVDPLHLEERVLGRPRVLLDRVLAADVLHLVLVALLALAARDELVDLARLLADEQLLLLGELEEVLGLALTVHAAGEAPLDVVDRRERQVVLDVVEGVLRDVREAHVRVARHVGRALVLVGLELADEQLDHRRLARAVDADDGDARGHRDLHADVVQRVDVARRVAEGAVDHLHERLGLRRDALEHARVGEGEGDAVRLELVVGGRLGHDLDELGEVARVDLELAVLLVVDHVLRDVVEEDGVVRDDHRRDLLVRELLHVLGQPRDAVDVDVVGRLVEQQQLGLLKHRAREREAHAPAAREGADGAEDELVLEGARAHHVDDLLLGLARAVVHALDHRVVVDELPADAVGVGGRDVALDVDGADLLGEALDEVGGDRAHQRRLARAVGADKAVALAALELEARVVQQHAVAVGEREGAVAQHGEVVVVLHFLLLDAGTELGGALLEEALGVDNRLGLRDDRLEVRHDHVHVARAARREERRGHLRDPLRDLVRVVRVAGEDLGDDSLDLDGRALDLDRLVLAERHLDRVERLLVLGADLGHGDLLGVALELGDELGSEGGDVGRVVDELEHGVDDDGGLAHHVHVALDAEAAHQHGHDDGQRRLVDGGDVRRGDELVEARLALGVGVHVGGDDGVDEGRHVGVVDHAAAVLQREHRRLLDGGLRVLRDLHELLDDLGQRGGDRLGRLRGEGGEELDRRELGLPAVLVELLEEQRQHRVDREGRERLHERLAGGVGLELDRAVLVGAEGHDGGEEGHQVRLGPQDRVLLRPLGEVGDARHGAHLGGLLGRGLGERDADGLGGLLVALLEDGRDLLGPGNSIGKLRHCC
mmetsp:Transcript_21464/g.36688  ORF Transcript_21464/g.36688 Transcript_21464/m.36688 type:complete len:1064 (-) Transcript_21464:37-3228(-)